MAETSPIIVPVDQLAESPYRMIVAYPGATIDAVEARIRQLHDLGVDELEFEGSLRIGKLSVLGKGVVGLVLSGKSGKKHLAVKIRRTDSRRGNMRHEADMVQAANNVDIGPEFFGSTNDILAMQFVEGKTLPTWIANLKGRGTRANIRSTFKVLFEQCMRLDAYGLDHGELSRAHKNVLVSGDGRPWILDYESASLMRRVNNFTSIAQYLFLSGFAKRVARLLGPIQRDELIQQLRLYKVGRTNDAFEAVTKMLRF